MNVSTDCHLIELAVTMTKLPCTKLAPFHAAAVHLAIFPCHRIREPQKYHFVILSEKQFNMTPS